MLRIWKMKKLFFGIIVFLLILIYCPTLNAETVYFKWIKTEIEVMYGDSLEKYKDLFELEFYVNGKISNDYEIEKETNCSTFSTVLTNRIGKYTVYYQAYSQKYNIRSEQAIIFHVVDKVAPEISCDSKEIFLDYGEEVVIENYLYISDNCCNLENIKVIPDYTQLNYQMLGDYPVVVKVVDYYNNESEITLMVKIIDRVKPTLKQIEPIRIEYGATLDVNKYFVALDNYDGNITQLIKVIEFDENKLGYQVIKVSVKDSSGNEIITSFNAEVVDKKEPIIVLNAYEISLPIEEFSLYDETYFSQFISSINDDYGNYYLDINLRNLREAVGLYEIQYFAIDNNDNCATATLFVKLLESNGPEITVNQPLVFQVGTLIDYKALVTVNDPYDSLAQNRLEIVSNNVDYQKAGTYQVVYRCYNSSGKFTMKSVDIIIESVNNKKIPITLIVSIIVIAITGSITCIFLYKKK